MREAPWFRMYGEAIDDEKLRLLAFEDRWHYVAILCLKAQGVLDKNDSLLMKKVAVKMGVDTRTLEDIARRLAEVNLIDEITLEPYGWENRQLKSDSSKERTKEYRERIKLSDTTETSQQFDPVKHLVHFGVDEQVAMDYVKQRKKKPSLTAINGLIGQAHKAKITLQEALEICCARGWEGFKAEWIADKRKDSNETPYQKTMREKFQRLTGQDQPREINVTNYSLLGD